MPEGSEALDPERPPPLGEGIPDGELRPPPELPDEPPDDPLEEEGDDVGDGIDEEEDWLAQPPMRSAEIALTVVTWAATTSSRFNRRWVSIVSPSIGGSARQRTPVVYVAVAAKTVRLIT